MAATASKNAITLKGSTDIVAEFFDYGINSILYQRGIYPPETFTRVQKYNLSLLMSTDDSIKKYLTEVINQIKAWLMDMTVDKLVVIIKSLATQEVLERWQFDVECDKTALTETQWEKAGNYLNMQDYDALLLTSFVQIELFRTIEASVLAHSFIPLRKPREKSEKDIQSGIQAVIRQITASVTFLPLIDEPCSFDLLVYTDKDLAVPESWGESGPNFVADAEEVRLRSFTTTIHKVDTMVAYKKNS